MKQSQSSSITSLLKWLRAWGNTT